MSSSTGCLEQKFKEIDAFIDSLPSLQGALVTVLHKAQEIYGYLPKELQLHISKRLDVPSAHVYGVVSFYSFFTMEPKGQCKISICMGTACFVCGAEAVLKQFEEELGIGPGETTADSAFSLDALRCLGACSLAPVVMINEKVYGKVSPSQVKSILAEYKHRTTEGGSHHD